MFEYYNGETPLNLIIISLRFLFTFLNVILHGFLKHWRILFPMLAGGLFGLFFSSLLVGLAPFPSWYRPIFVVACILFAFAIFRKELDQIFPPNNSKNNRR